MATTALPPESLRLTPLQKDRLRNPEILIELPETRCSPPNIDGALDKLERLIGVKAAGRVSSILAATQYGLSETEILELIMPTGEEKSLSLEAAQFNFSTWCLARRTMNPWLMVSNEVPVRKP